jgi:hypothetical protein
MLRYAGQKKEYNLMKWVWLMCSLGVHVANESR